jgi:hypothetical protein
MKWLENEIEEIKDEHSIARMLTSWPTCTFNGIELQMFVTCIKNGSIKKPSTYQYAPKDGQLDDLRQERWMQSLTAL